MLGRVCGTHGTRVVHAVSVVPGSICCAGAFCALQAACNGRRWRQQRRWRDDDGSGDDDSDDGGGQTDDDFKFRLFRFAFHVYICTFAYIILIFFYILFWILNFTRIAHAGLDVWAVSCELWAMSVHVFGCVCVWILDAILCDFFLRSPIPKRQTQKFLNWNIACAAKPCEIPHDVPSGSHAGQTIGSE